MSWDEIERNILEYLFSDSLIEVGEGKVVDMKGVMIIEDEFILTMRTSMIGCRYFINRMVVSRHLHQFIPLPGKIFKCRPHLIYILPEHSKRPDEHYSRRYKFMMQIESHDDQDTHGHQHVRSKPFPFIYHRIPMEYWKDISYSLTNGRECTVFKSERNHCFYITQEIK